MDTSEVRDYSPITSPGTIEQFMTGTIYLDFIGELNIRIKCFRDMLELSEDEIKAQGLTSDMLRGGIKNARQMKGIFQDIMNNAERDQENDDN